MIKKIKLTNFFSFLDETIDCNKGTNLLLGINGSGKSNLLKAFRVLQEGISGMGLKNLIYDTWGGFDSIAFKGKGQNENPEKISLFFTLDGKIFESYGKAIPGEISYEISLIKISGPFNFYVRESLEILNENGKREVLLKFENGRGNVHQKTSNGQKNNGTTIKFYPPQDPQELVLRGNNFTEEVIAIRKVFSQIRIYDYFDVGPESKVRQLARATGDKYLSRDGSNLATVINSIKLSSKTAYKKLISSLCEINDAFEDFEFNFYSSGQFELFLSEKGLETPIHLAHVSDGTLRYLCLLAIFLNPQPGSIFCIDEPELGLHPDMLKDISIKIQEFSHKKPIFIATHSENIVNHFMVEDIRVFEKNEANSTEVYKYTSNEFEGWYDGVFNPGQMWREGDFGGNRY